MVAKNVPSSLCHMRSNVTDGRRRSSNDFQLTGSMRRDRRFRECAELSSTASYVAKLYVLYLVVVTDCNVSEFFFFCK